MPFQGFLKLKNLFPRPWGCTNRAWIIMQVFGRFYSPPLDRDSSWLTELEIGVLHMKLTVQLSQSAHPLVLRSRMPVEKKMGLQPGVWVCRGWLRTPKPQCCSSARGESGGLLTLSTCAWLLSSCFRALAWLLAPEVQPTRHSGLCICVDARAEQMGLRPTLAAALLFLFSGRRFLFFLFAITYCEWGIGAVILNY